MSQALKDKIRDCTSLPSLPAAALSVLQLTQNDSTGMDELAATIAKDSALSVKILRAINSSFYGLNQKVSSVQQAVALLGLHSVKTLVLGFSLVSNLKGQGSKGFDHLNYWRRSMYAATAARILAQKLLPSRVDDCFVAALLMDLGTLVLDQLLGEQYSALYDKIKTHNDLLIVETHALGMTHAEVGGVLAEHWKLPEVLKVPMARHHGASEVEDAVMRQVTEIVGLAGRCADIFVGECPADSIMAVRTTLLQQYKVPELAADALLVEIGRKTSELAPLFEVRLNSSVNYDAIVNKASERLLELSLAGNGEEQSNKRKATRMRRDGKILITPCERGILGRPVQVRLRDLSASGMGVIHSDRLEKGAQFIVQLPQANGQTKSLLYTVMRCDTSGGLSSIGAELACVLRPEKGDAQASAAA